MLPTSARELILSGTALAHMITLNPDGSPTPLPNGMHPNLVVHGTAVVTEGGAPELVSRLATVYVASDLDYPLPPAHPPGTSSAHRSSASAVSALG